MKYMKNVISLTLDASRCNGCGRCIEVCPRHVFEKQEKKVRIINPDNCIECGACELNCESQALSVNSGVGCAAALIRTCFNPSAEAECGCGSGCCGGESKNCCE